MLKKILMVCTHFWTSPFQVGSHHLARQFARTGYRVAYVSAPLTPLHLFSDMSKDVSARFKIYCQGGSHTKDGRIWYYVPGTLIAPTNRPVLRSRFMLQNWPGWSFPGVVKTIRRQGFDKVDILYLDTLFQPFWIDAVQWTKSVFRFVDYHPGFPGSGASLARVTQQIAQSVDLCVYSSKNLGTYVHKLNPQKSAHIPNGIDFHVFESGSRALPGAYQSIPAPIAVYVGSMDAWFDLRLLATTAQRLPEISFVLIGSHHNASSLRSLPSNIHLLGPVKHEDLPQYLYNAHAGIIPFDTARFPDLINSVNPLKLYEYMACGLPVVSTSWKELQNLESPATLCHTTDDFIGAVKKAVYETHDKQKLVEYAKAHDWSISFEKLQAAL